MEFDKSKIYTVVNADEVKIGSKGYFANTILELETCVELEASLNELEEIFSKDISYRFKPVNNNGISYMLFYLVEEPEEKKYRPYKDTNEMIEDFLKRYNYYSEARNAHNPMCNPLIWGRSVHTGFEKLVVGIAKDRPLVYFASEEDGYSLVSLFEDFTYLDGTPCGKLEE